jgi:hypothetical protein
LLGSVRSDRHGIKAARFVEQSFKARGHEVTLVDPVEGRMSLREWQAGGRSIAVSRTKPTWGG